MSGTHAERRDSKFYQFVYETEFGKYSFNGVDAGLDPGPKRPFNFFGQFSEVHKPQIITSTSRQFQHLEIYGLRRVLILVLFHPCFWFQDVNLRIMFCFVFREQTSPRARKQAAMSLLKGARPPHLLVTMGVNPLKIRAYPHLKV